jgi:hypothetical protein
MVNIKNKIADARGNLVIGSNNVVQNNTNGIDARALLEFAGLVGQIAPTLGLPATEQAELQSAAAALHEAASEPMPEKGRLPRLGDAVMQGLTKAAPTVASQMALASGGYVTEARRSGVVGQCTADDRGGIGSSRKLTNPTH